MPARKNGYFSKADDWVIKGVAYDSAGAILDLTGATVKLRVAREDGTLIWDYATPTNGTITNAVGGAWQFVIPNATVKAAALTDERYKYEVHVTLADGSESDQNVGVIFMEDSLFA